MAVRVGDVGRAVSPMSPSGAVELAGVRHDARSDGVYVPAGAAVEVVRADPTGLVVRPVEPGNGPLPDHGREIIKAEFQRNSADVAETEARELAERWRRHVRRVVVAVMLAEPFGMAVGFATFVSLVACKTFHDPERDREYAVLIGSVLVGGGWAAAVTLAAGVVSWRLDRGRWFGPVFALAVGVIAPAVTFFVLFKSEAAGPLAGWVAVAAVLGAVAGWLADRGIRDLCTVLVNDG